MTTIVTINAQMTLAEIVTVHPSLTRALADQGLDYCCGGGVTLEQACADLRLEPAVVLAELAAATTDEEPAAWSTMTPGQLVDHIESTHHRYLWRELPRLRALMDKVFAAHGDRHPELVNIRACFEEIRADIEPHLMKEEEVLFPMVRELATAATQPSLGGGSIEQPIAVMLSEHDMIGDLLRRLRTVTGGYRTPPDGCASYAALFTGFEALEADTHLHIHKENNLLFPAVVDPGRCLQP